MRRAGRRPVGSGTDRTWGWLGAGQPRGHTGRPAGARAGPTGPSCCAARPPRLAPVVQGQRDLGARLDQCGTTRSCLSVVPEPGAWGGRKSGAVVVAGAAATTLLTQPQRPGRVGMKAASHTGTLPSEGAGVRVPATALGAGRQGLLLQLAGQCRAVSLSWEGTGMRWGESGSIPVLCLPRGADAKPRNRATGAEHSPRGLTWHCPQEGAAGGCCSPPTGRCWGRTPRHQGRGWLESGWAGGSRSRGKRAPPWGLGPQEITIITK